MLFPLSGDRPPSMLWVAEPSGRRRQRQSGRLAAIDRLLRNDVESQRLTRRIRARQHALSQGVNARSWTIYLEIEELELRRSLRWMHLVVRWAERRGARTARRARSRGGA